MEATTASLEALKAYSLSIRVGYTRGCTASVPFGKRAVELDPLFAMAYSHLGRCYSNLGESVLATDSIAKAFQLRDRASDREKLYITLNYDRELLDNLLKAEQVCDLRAQTYPRDAVSHGSPRRRLRFQTAGMSSMPLHSPWRLPATFSGRNPLPKISSIASRKTRL